MYLSGLCPISCSLCFNCEMLSSGRTTVLSGAKVMVQVAVPKEMATSEDEEAVQKFLFDSLREANKIAAEYFEKKGIEYSQENYLAIVDAVEAKFQQS